MLLNLPGKYEERVMVEDFNCLHNFTQTILVLLMMAGILTVAGLIVGQISVGVYWLLKKQLPDVVDNYWRDSLLLGIAILFCVLILGLLIAFCYDIISCLVYIKEGGVLR